MLHRVSQRLSDGERSWEADKRGLEGQLNRTLHSLRESQATADQLRSASQHGPCSGSAVNSLVALMQLGCLGAVPSLLTGQLSAFTHDCVRKREC